MKAVVTVPALAKRVLLDLRVLTLLAEKQGRVDAAPGLIGAQYELLVALASWDLGRPKAPKRRPAKRRKKS